MPTSSRNADIVRNNGALWASPPKTNMEAETIMDINKIRALAEVLAEHNLYELTLEENGEKLTIKHPSGKVAEAEHILSAVKLMPSAANAHAPSLSQYPIAPAPPFSAAHFPNPSVQPTEAEKAQEEEPAARVAEDEIVITSPMVGIFYASPSPEQPPFKEVGQHVNEGDVLCIIEAMKLMNEITADQSGTVIETYCENGALVEFGQKLFKLRVG